jgi:peptidoglycan/LPS O-acetylase OafA/YrhL
LTFTLIELSILFVVILVVSSEFEHKSLFLSLLFSIQVFIFAFEKGSVSTFLTQKIFLYFGKLSYSIYMLHAAVLFVSLSMLMVTQKVWGIDLTLMISDRRYIDMGSDFSNNLVVLLILGVIIFISQFTYKYIEMKGQAQGKKVLNLLNNNKERKKQRLMS